MTIYDAPNLTGGIDQTLVSLVGEVPVFIPMFLFFIFSMILIGGIINQKRRMGIADVPMWSVMASLGTLMATLPLTLIEGLIQVEILSVVVVITIFSGIWLFLDRNRNEV